MNKIRAKLTALLMAAGCCLGCVGVGVAAMQPKDVVAKAATTEELTAEITNNGQFAFGVSSKTDKGYSIIDGSAAKSTLPAGYSGAVLEVYHSTAIDGYDFVTLDFTGKEIFAADVNSIIVRMWVDNFNSGTDEFRTIGAVTGTQRQYGTSTYDFSNWCDVTLNANSIADMKDANGYLTSIDLGIREKTAASHLYIDSVTIDFIDYTTHELGAMKYSDKSADNKFVYLKPVSGSVTKADDGNGGWTAVYAWRDGVGITLNGESVSNATVKFPGSMFIDLKKAPTAGDILRVGGTFYNASVATKYVVAESAFEWNGEKWVEYVSDSPEVEYTIHNLGALAIHSNGGKANYIYLKRADGGTLPFKGWENPFVLVRGDGLKVNGEKVAMGEMQSSEAGLYVTFNAVNEGDVLSISGAFRCDNQLLEYVIAESKFVWNGTTWEPYYTIHDLGKLAVHNNSNGKTTNTPSATQLYMKIASGMAIPYPDSNWNTEFLLEIGAGWKLNSTDINALVSDLESTNSGLFVNLANANVQVGDVLSVEGTFVCPEEGVMAKYVIAESKFTWNGTIWEDYVDYETYTVTKVGSTKDSSATVLYLYSLGGDKLPKETHSSWNHAYTLVEGSGLTLNGAAVPGGDVKLPGDLYMEIGTTANAGDVMTLDGTYVNEEKAVKLVFVNCQLQWNGEKWIEYVAEPEVPDEPEVPEVEYTVYTITKIGGWINENQTFLYSTEGDALPKDKEDWSNVYTFEAGSGSGITFNGETINTTDIKQPGDFYIGLGRTPVVGDIFTIDGTYYNENTARKIVFVNCTVKFDGTKWVHYVEYTTTELGTLKFQKAENDNKFFYLQSAGGVTISTTDWDAYTLVSGVGVKINDVAVGATVKFPGSVFIDFATAPTLAVGDKLTIGGTYVHEKNAVKYVITETTLWYDGTTWSTEAPVQYTTYEIGAVAMHNNGGKANHVYLKRADGAALPFEGWENPFVLESGDGLKVNGQKVSIIDMQSSNAGLYVKFNAVNVGDVISIGGTFRCEKQKIEYIIEESKFVWGGSFWAAYLTEVAAEELEVYDVVSLSDVGMGMEVSFSGTVDQYTGKKFTTSANNTTNSVAFRFGFNSADTAAADANLCFRLRGSAWQGVKFWIQNGRITLADAKKSCTLASNTDYEIELGAISMKDGNVWTYVKLNNILVLSEVISTSQFSEFADFETTGFTNHFSLYCANVAETTLKDVTNIAVTFTSTAGSYAETISKGDTLVLPTGKSSGKTFIGWACDGTLYQAGAEFGVATNSITFTAVELDFSMENGAAIRVAGSADESGIRFTTWMSESEYNALLGQYGITNVAYGTLIMPYDYLGEGQVPNLNDFDPEKDEILKIASTKNETKDGYIIFRGAMKKLYTANYGRLFAGRAYMEITFANSEVWTIYTPFNYEDNVRSIRGVAQAFQADKSAPSNENELRYDKLSDAEKAVVDTYAAASEINLMNYSSYANNSMNLTAWYYPALDESNAYNNATNIAITDKMKAAGIKVVYLDGMHYLDLSVPNNIGKTRQIIEFFWSQGLKTIAFGANLTSFSTTGYPDYSDCEGFMGFLAWDEPIPEKFETLAELAREFEKAYAGTDVTFMVNLLPSYASIFNGTTHWWESSLNSLKKDEFKAYLQDYCDIVLSQVSGEKWLSLDSYPINKNEALTANFLFDVAMLKYYAELNGAHAHMVLQSSGWIEGEQDGKDRMPTAAEMEMQAYAAMAFGVDSISWWSYSNKRGDNQKNPTDSDEYYQAFAAANNEIAAIQKVYSAFDWKGVILGAGKNNSLFGKDNDFEAYNVVKGQIGNYELTASNTKHLASVSTNKTDLNYLMGVMEDANGNEGYVLCNYNSHEEDRTQTITLTFDSNITEVVIYRNGVAETVSVTNKTLAVSLATGEGVIILPSKLG